MKHIVFVGLGSNLDDPVAQVSRALDALDSLPQTSVVRRSSLYRSAPVGYLAQPDFVNAVAQLETELTPRALLDAQLSGSNDGRLGHLRALLNGTYDRFITKYGCLSTRANALAFRRDTDSSAARSQTRRNRRAR